MNATTSKQQVQAVYPTAKSRRVRSAGYWYQYRVEADGVELGVDCCPQGAWRDAASKLPAPISGGSPEADGGQHSAPATDGGAIGPVEVVAAGAELYRETFATTKSTVRRFMRADAAMAVRRMFRALPAEDRLALRPHLVALCPEAREGDPETMLEAWFLDVCQRLGSGLGIESAACPVSSPPAGGDFDGADLPELDDAERVALEVLGEAAMDRLARMTEGEAAMAMDAMGVMPLSGGAPDGAEVPKPDLRDINTDDYRNAPAGDGPQAYQWVDKPHRLVYDLCLAVQQIRAERDELLEALRQTMGLLEMYDRDYGLPPGWREHTGGADEVMAKALGIPPVSGGAPGPELLPCPFCGSTATKGLWASGDRDVVTCGGCGVVLEKGMQGTTGDAVELWNARAPHPDHAAVMADLKRVIMQLKWAVERSEALDRLDEDGDSDSTKAERAAYERLQAAVDRFTSRP